MQWKAGKSSKNFSLATRNYSPTLKWQFPLVSQINVTSKTCDIGLKWMLLSFSNRGGIEIKRAGRRCETSEKKLHPKRSLLPLVRSTAQDRLPSRVPGWDLLVGTHSAECHREVPNYSPESTLVAVPIRRTGFTRGGLTYGWRLVVASESCGQVKRYLPLTALED